MEALATIVDGSAEKIEIEVVGAEGIISGLEKGKISVRGVLGSNKYVLADEDLVIKIDDEIVTEGFNEFYYKWHDLGANYYVDIELADGVVTRINAVTM